MRSLIYQQITDKLLELSKGERVGDIALVGSMRESLYFVGREQFGVAEMVGELQQLLVRVYLFGRQILLDDLSEYLKVAQHKFICRSSLVSYSQKPQALQNFFRSFGQFRFSLLLNSYMLVAYKKQILGHFKIFTIMIKINELELNKENLSFEELGLKQQLVKGLSSNGHILPRYQQTLYLPNLIAKKDCLIVGPFQSGKRMALVIACLQMIDPSIPHCQAILLAHSRELAYRLYDTITKLCSDLGIAVRVLVGGTMARQDRVSLWAGGIQLVVSTPGRVKDLISKGELRPDYMLFCGLVDVDQLLCRGFNDQILDIFRELTNDCQIAISSSTFNTEIQELALKSMRDPCLIEASRINLVNKQKIKHFFIVCRSNQQKMDLLLENIQLTSCLIFIEDKETAEDLMTKLKERQFEVQTAFNYQQLTRYQYEENKIPIRKKQIILCLGMEEAFYTCRYLDPDLIINFDMPKPHEYPWRTTMGEMSKERMKRTVISFVTEQEKQHVQTLSQFYNIPINYLPFFL